MRNDGWRDNDDRWHGDDPRWILWQHLGFGDKAAHIGDETSRNDYGQFWTVAADQTVQLRLEMRRVEDSDDDDDEEL